MGKTIESQTWVELKQNTELNELKDQLMKEDLKLREEDTKSELSKLWYSFIKRLDWTYRLQKDSNYNRPNMENYSETLDVEIDNLDILIRLAKLIENKVKAFKGNLDPYLESSFITKGLFLWNSDSPKNIYNKEYFMWNDILNPDSLLISVNDIAYAFWIEDEDQEKNREYMNWLAWDIIQFMVKIKIDERAYNKKQEVLKKSQTELKKEQN